MEHDFRFFFSVREETPNRWDVGVYLHQGNTRIKIAENPDELDEFAKNIESIIKEIREIYPSK